MTIEEFKKILIELFYGRDKKDGSRKVELGSFYKKLKNEKR